MVVAKTEAAHHALSRDFALRRIDRAYAALVWGVPTPPAGVITGNIGRSAANRKKMALVGEGKGRPAITHYRVERSFGSQAALVECRLATGRTHQIRVHLTHRGHPLIGDPVYGTRAGRAVERSSTVGAGSPRFPVRPCTRVPSASHTRTAAAVSVSPVRYPLTFANLLVI